MILETPLVSEKYRHLTTVIDFILVKYKINDSFLVVHGQSDKMTREVSSYNVGKCEQI